MSTPVIDQIANEILSRIEQVSVGSGYDINVSSVKRPTRRGAELTHTDYSVLLEQGTAERNGELTRASAAGLQIAWDQEFVITCFLLPSDTDTNGIDSLANVAAMALMQGITSQGAAHWHTFGGYAINATFTGGIEPFNDEQSSGVKIRLLVTYRTDEHNPAQERL